MSTAQPNLFDRLLGGSPAQRPLTREQCLPPRSRTADAASSHRAEAELKRSGAMKGQRLIALELIEKHPGSTAAQLAQFHAPLDSEERFKAKVWLRKRLPELREMKLARTTQIGNSDLLWWPAEED